MRIISSREFNDNQKLYFDLADQNEQIIVQRGKDKAYMLIPITESDRLSTNPALINKIKDSERAIREGKTTKINDIDNIWESIL
jgi:antitoxin YefM